MGIKQSCSTLLILLVIYGCVESNLTTYENYKVHPDHLEFGVLNSELRANQRLYLSFNEETFTLYHTDTIYHSGVLNESETDMLISAIDNLKMSQLDRVYNSNSADNLLYYIKIGGKHPDYGHTIFSYGHTDALSEVNEAIDEVRKVLKSLGASKLRH